MKNKKMKNKKMNLEILKISSVKPIKFINKNRELICIVILLMLCFTPVFAQTPAPTDGIDGKIGVWKGTITTTLNLVVSVFAIVGGFLIFIQYMQGNEQAQKNFIRFIIGLAIFGLVAVIADVFLKPKA